MSWKLTTPIPIKAGPETNCWTWDEYRRWLELPADKQCTLGTLCKALRNLRQCYTCLRRPGEEYSLKTHGHECRHP